MVGLIAVLLGVATVADAVRQLGTARGVEFIGPEKGLLSCGYEGLGRLWPVARVAARAVALLRERRPAKRRG